MLTTRSNAPVLVLLLLVVALSSSGCQLVEGIFKAGLWVGIFMVVIVLALVMFLVGKVRR